MKKHYLNKMGIISWHFRNPQTRSYYLYHLYQDQECVGTLLADAELKTSEEEQLIRAIARATQKRVVGGMRADPLNEHLKEGRVIIALGSGVAKEVQKLTSVIRKKKLIKSYSPAILLEKTHLKAETWEVLKASIALMNSTTT